VLEHYNIDPKRVVTIPRGVDLDLFDAEKIDPTEIATLRAAWGLAPGDKRLVVILPARLTRWKGQMVLIDAAARVENRKPGLIKVILAGDAQGRSGYVTELETAIMGAGLLDSVAVVGHLSQIPTALAASCFRRSNRKHSGAARSRRRRWAFR